MKRSLLLCVLFVFITGCLPWVRTSGPYQSTYLNISADLPDGWMRRDYTSRSDIFLTRDGAYLQYIMVEPIHMDAELRGTKKKFRKGMMAQELAEVIIDNTSSREDVLNFKVISNKPYTVAGHPGFRMVYTFRDTDGLKYKSLYYGFMEGEWFYGLSYSAPERYYYKRDLMAFKKVRDSLKLLN